MFRIGLTGGVGCGKSTVSRYLSSLGIPIVDGDRIAHEATEPGSAVMRDIERVFGKEMLKADGALRREKLAAVVFADEEKRQALNGIIHPYVWQKAMTEMLAAEAAGYSVIVLDMPLLIEIGWHLRVNAVWVVAVSPDVQIRRVCLRDGVTEEQAMARIRNQMPTERKIGYADIVIDNSGTPDETYRQVDAALKKLAVSSSGSAFGAF